MRFEEFATEREQLQSVGIQKGVEHLRSLGESGLADLVIFLDRVLSREAEKAKDEPYPDRTYRDILLKHQILDSFLMRSDWLVEYPEDNRKGSEAFGMWKAHAFDVIDIADYLYEDYVGHPYHHAACIRNHLLRWPGDEGPMRVSHKAPDLISESDRPS